MRGRLAKLTIPRRAFDSRVGACTAVGCLGTLTAILAPLVGEEEIVVVTMLFLLVVLLASAIWGYAVGLLGAVLAEGLLNIFFVPPLGRPTVHEPRNIATLLIFLAVAVVGASMLALLRRQLRAAEARRVELAAMLTLSQDLANASSPQRAVDALALSIARSVKARRCNILRRSARGWEMIASTGTVTDIEKDDAAMATAATESGSVVRRVPRDRRRTSSMIRVGGRPATDTFLPFRAGTQAGVIHLMGPLTAPGGGDLDALLRAFADETAVALDRVRLAEQAREAEVVRRSDELKSVLLSSVSHDLRSPLTAIKAAVGSLRDPSIALPEDDRSQLLTTIESQTDRLTETVSDLLTMSRLEGGAVEPELEPVEVLPLLQDARVATETATAGREVCVQADPGIWVRVDYALILRALGNLIENASRYSTPGGTIRARANTSPGRVFIEVADEGPGIPTQDLPHIFDKFYRGSASKGTQGSGLGLAIVQSMVELCRGSITVTSSPEGTTFRIALPASRAPR